MKNSDLEWMEAYLNGDMSEEERARFEAELAQNNDLASHLALYQLIEHTMRSKEQKTEQEASLRKTLETLGNLYFNASPVEEQKEDGGLQMPIGTTSEEPLREPDKEEERKDKSRGVIKRLYPWVRVAVAISTIGFVILCLTWYLQQKDTASIAANQGDKEQVTPANQQKKADSKSSNMNPESASLHSSPPGLPPSTTAKATKRRDSVPGQAADSVAKTKANALFARHFKPDAVPKRGKEYLGESVSFYEARDYSRAVAAFEEITSAPPTRGQTDEEALIEFYARYYQAISYLALGNTTQAIRAFKGLSTTNAYLQAKVHWYLSLTYLKAGQVTEAERLLVELTENSLAKDYQQKARNLQQAIRAR